MTTHEFTRVEPDWLAAREEADAAARSTALLGPLRACLAPPVVVHDLGCGTGSMARWLMDRLPGPQRWILQDRDPDLLALAEADLARRVEVTPVLGDVTDLRAADLAGTSLVTTSALLDLLTAAEVARIADACVTAGCPALLTLSVTGDVRLFPTDPLDAELTAAFNAHQRRTTRGRRMLGPDAVAVAAAEFQRRGATVLCRPSPWRLGSSQAVLRAEWLTGWVGAAVEQRPELAARARSYLQRRSTARFRVVVGHTDLLALPGGWP